MRRLQVAVVVLGLGLAATAQSPGVRSFRVRETMGIRRTEYPVTARFTFEKGVLKNPAETRVVSNGTEVAAQVASPSLWDDQSVQSLEVDFNASLDPEEDRRYQLQFGAGVSSTAQPARTVKAEELPDAIQVGSIRFSKSGSPLLQSVTYRGEGIGQGANGVAITDIAGQRHDLASAGSPTMTIVKPGPLIVVLRYTATIPLDTAYSVPLELMLEMPVSKSWVKMTATLRDPARRVRDIAIETPLALGEAPWLWDFGTDTGTYGVFRSPTDGVALTQTVKSGDASSSWKIETVAQGQRRSHETSAGPRAKTASGWGHMQDAKAAVAFAVEQFGRAPGTYAILLDGRGQTTFKFAPMEPATQHRLAVYEHFVSTPVAIGATTNPTAMLNPPTVVIER